MDGITRPPLGATKVDIGQVVSNLVQNDLYFETVLYAITEILKTKLGADGKPILSVEEMETKVKECMDHIRAQSQITQVQKPSIIIPK